MNKVAIIGAGASGLMLSGLLCRRKDLEVFVFDKNEKVGKKLYITGKGRCNITNLCEPEEYLQNVVRGDKFLRSAIYSFTSKDCVNFFEEIGLKTKLERGNRIFPESDKSSDVIKALTKHCENVQFRLNENVCDIIREGDGFQVVTKIGKYHFDRVVIATGGKSYSSTGSTGDGYAFAKKMGHKIEDVVPALCPIKLKDKFVQNLQGVSLKNVQLNILADGKRLHFFGEMVFTDIGISGPIVLTASSYVNRCKDVQIFLDFKPALTEKQLDARLLREFEENKNKTLKNILKNLLPKAVADIFAGSIGLDENKKIHDITKAEREKLLYGLKNFNLTYGGLYPLDSGIVTSGGVCLKEVDPKTFQSKLQKGLYFLGEVLDLEAVTGGFNLQIAWATAQSCARNFE